MICERRQRCLSFLKHQKHGHERQSRRHHQEQPDANDTEPLLSPPTTVAQALDRDAIQQPERVDLDLARGVVHHPAAGGAGLLVGGPIIHPKAPTRRYTNPHDTYFTLVYSSITYFPPSRPKPECFTPPNGAWGVEGAASLAPTMPYCRASAVRIRRVASLV